MIEIKRNNKVFFTLEDVCDGSKLSRQLMDHHYVILKFSSDMPVHFEVGDSVEIPDFGYFELTSAYFPKYNNSTGGYDYEMQMDAYYMAWKNKLCKFRPQHGANETSFKLTTKVSGHLSVILSNLKALGLTYNGKDFSVDYTTYNKDVFDTEKHFYVEYSSISILEALNAICESLDCEWWVDGSIIYLGYCELSGQTTFEHGVNMLSMSQSASKSSFITRLYAFGSDKNIPTGYFTGPDADATTEGIATDYLMLPTKGVDKDGFFCKNGYMENANVVKNDKQAIEGIVIFSDEYPKVECTVSNIKTYDSTVEENGGKVTETFWQVASSDRFATSFSASWIKRNLTLMIKFMSGSLIGMEFEASFKVIEQDNYFEIVANDTYGRKLPDPALCPKVGDKFFIYNWDATKITETDLIQEAQESLFERAKTYYKKSMIDNSNFTCELDGEKFYNHGIYDYHPIGEQVKLIDPMFSDTDANGKHYRNSRIIGMEIKLDIPYDSPQYIVGEKAAYSRLGKLEEKVDSITVNGIKIGSAGSGGGVYVIGTNDSTPVTDSNVFSARRSRQEFLSKKYDDVTNGHVTFQKGITSNGDIEVNADLHTSGDLSTSSNLHVNQSAEIGQDINVRGNATIGGTLGVTGNATLTDVVVDRVHDAKSTPAERVIVGAQGFDLYIGEDGKSHLYIDYLTARTKFFAASAEVRKVSYSGGTTLFSNAGSTIMKVVDVLNDSKVVIAYKCYALADDGTTKTMNWWHPGMMALCQTFNVKAGDTDNLSNRYYWRLVVGVGQETLSDGKLYDYVILSNKKTFVGNEAVVPIGSTQVIGWNGHPLVFGNVAIEVVSDGGIQSFATVVADYEGLTNDESGTAIASRVFYGYEPASDGGEPDAPLPYDVIVQAGDQVQWGKYGNLIKLTTSVEDGVDAANSPSIAMYHNMGAPYKVGGGVNPYQWKTLTSLDSPELVLKNANIFKFFTDDDPNNIIDPITVSYEINASADFIIRKPTTQTATPTDMTFAVTKRTGSKTEDATATVNLFADYTTTDGVSNADVPIKRLSDIGVSFYALSSVTIKAKDKSGGDTIATLSIPVLSDGEQGSAGAQGQPGQPGTNGTDGKDAVEFVTKDAPMVFDTATDGVVPTNTSKTAKIYVYRGGVNVSAQPIAGIVDQQGCSGARVTKLSDHFEVTLEGRYIKKDGGVSVTSGYVAVQLTYDGKAYVQQVPFLVNVAKFTGTVNANNTELSSKYTELSNKQMQTDKDVANLQTTVNGVPIKTSNDLTKYTSEIKQTAREISVEVSSEAVRSGRNMLLGSDFHRQGYGYAPNGTAFTESSLKIRTYDGFAGCNSLFIEQTAIGNSYAGVRWSDLPVTGGKTYVISAWLKRMSDTFGDRCSIIVHEYAGNGTTIAKNNSFTALDADADPKGTWRKKAITVTLQATTTRVNVIFCLGSTGAFSLCQPMMEEGTESNGWTLATADYGYIMGNRIVGSLALTKNAAALAQDGSTASIAGLYGTVIKGEEGVATVERDAQATKTQLSIVVQGYLKANTDYVLSFDVRRIDGKDDGCAFVSFVREVLYSELYSGNVSIYSKENGNAHESGYLEIKPSGEWQRVWVHFRLSADWTDATGKNFNIGVFGGNGTGNSIRAQFRRPKLEACAAMTEYTDAQADYIEDENISKKLRRTGIDITNGRITLDAKKTTVTGDLTVQGIITDSTSYVDVDGTLWSPNDVGELVNTKKNLRTVDGGVFAPIDMMTIKSLQIQTADPSSFGVGSTDLYPYPALVTLPMYDAVDLGCGITIPAYRRSGTHVLIRNGFSLAYSMWAKSASWGDANNKYTALRNEIANTAVYICTDPRLLSLDNYKYATPTITPDGQDYNGASATAEWFKGGCFLNGRRGRWIALLPGQEIELVSVITMWKTGTNTAVPYLAWYVVGGSNIDWLDKLISISIRPDDSAYNGYEGYFEQEITGGQHFGVGSLDKYRDAFFGPRQLSDGYVDGLAAQTVVVTLSANEAPYLSVQ